jgi:ferrous iron transport protein B
MKTEILNKQEISVREKTGINEILIAVAGNPNSGKSTLINAIAGTRLQVGNWPGVTVEKKAAVIEHEGRKIHLVDLPGVYSLSPYTQEEIITRDYLVHEKPDVIINVVDSTNLERNLYLTLQLIELEIPVVLALNMYDEAGAKGYRFDLETLASMLGVTVIPTTATKGSGVKALMTASVAAADNTNEFTPRPVPYNDDIERAVDLVAGKLRAAYPAVMESYPPRWLALKLIEGDLPMLDRIGMSAENRLIADAVSHLKKAHGDDVEALIADARYGVAAGLIHESLSKPEVRKEEITGKIDSVVLNRFLGIPIFLAAMWIMFKLTFDVSKPFADWLSAVTSGPLKRMTVEFLAAVGAPAWTASLVTDGIIAGVGSVLVFVPVIFAMMFFITFLEGSGYMARAAFVMDRAMHMVGLHGKSFIPMLLGFGCNVPAIYATRTLENPKDKALTALLIPLTSCGARLPVYVVFIGAFFTANAGTVLWSLYVLGIALALLAGMIFKRTLFKEPAPMFVMELPPFRMPSMRSLLIHTWEKGKHFLIKAGTYILAVSVIVWFMLNMPWGVENKKDSYMGQIGQVIAPALQPLGFGTWEAGSSLMVGLVAKEIVVGTMGEIYAQKEEPEDKNERLSVGEELLGIAKSFGTAVKEAGGNVISTVGIATISAGESEEKTAERMPLREELHKQFTPLTAYSFIVFVLLYMPCAVVAVAMRQEFGTWKWYGIAFAYQMVLAWSVAFIIYQGGSLLGIGG